MLSEGYGEALIENLWKTFFCVSANLATGKAVVHQSGLLWRALSASTAIPGIFPPLMENHQVLVDGGIIGQFSDQCDALVAARTGDRRRGLFRHHHHPDDVDIESKSLLWLLLRGRTQVPSIVRILMCSGMVNSESQTAASRAATDVLIQPMLDGIDMLSFKAFDRAIDAGYRAAMEAMPRLTLPV